MVISKRSKIAGSLVLAALVCLAIALFVNRPTRGSANCKTCFVAGPVRTVAGNRDVGGDPTNRGARDNHMVQTLPENARADISSDPDSLADLSFLSQDKEEAPGTDHMFAKWDGEGAFGLIDAVAQEGSSSGVLASASSPFLALPSGGGGASFPQGKGIANPVPAAAPSVSPSPHGAVTTVPDAFSTLWLGLPLFGMFSVSRFAVRGRADLAG